MATKPTQLSQLKKVEKIGELQIRSLLVKARNKMDLIILNAVNNKRFASSAKVRDGLYAALGSEYVKLGGQVGAWEKSRITSIARQWRKLAISDIPKGVYNQSWQQFSTKYVKDMVERVNPTNASKIAGVRARMGGMLNNDIRVLRNSVIETFREASVTGMNSGQRLRAMRNKVLSNKPSWEFIDAGGKKWKTNNYFKMLNKTISANTARSAYEDTMTEGGMDLATIEGGTSGNCCDVCNKWSGRIVSLTGVTKGYPSADEARGEGLFHPSCVHYIAAVLPGESTEQPNETKGLEEEEFAEQLKYNQSKEDNNPMTKDQKSKLNKIGYSAVDGDATVTQADSIISETERLSNLKIVKKSLSPEKLELNLQNKHKVGKSFSATYSRPTVSSGKIDIGLERTSTDILNIGNGNYTIGGDKKSIFRHELGHHIKDTQIDRFDWEDATKDFKKLTSKKTKELAKQFIDADIKRLSVEPNNRVLLGKIKRVANKRAGQEVGREFVSGYASSNQEELFAESFAAFTSPKYKSGMLPKPIEEFMVKTIK